MEDGICWCRQNEKWLRTRRLSSSETAVFVVSESSPTAHDNNAVTTTGAMNATLQTVSEVSHRDM